MNESDIKGQEAIAQQATGAIPRGLPMAQREKYWEECNADEKIERLRNMLMNINADNAEFAQIGADLLRHSHDDNGNIVVPIRVPGGNDLHGYARDRAHSIKTKRERGDRW